jgi:hypothetical protein
MQIILSGSSEIGLHSLYGGAAASGFDFAREFTGDRSLTVAAQQCRPGAASSRCKIDPRYQENSQEQPYELKNRSAVFF